MSEWAAPSERIATGRFEPIVVDGAATPMQTESKSAIGGTRAAFQQTPPKAVEEGESYTGAWIISMAIDHITAMMMFDGAGNEKGEKFAEGDTAFRTAAAACTPIGLHEDWRGAAAHAYAQQIADLPDWFTSMAETDGVIRQLIHDHEVQVTYARIVLGGLIGALAGCIAWALFLEATGQFAKAIIFQMRCYFAAIAIALVFQFELIGHSHQTAGDIRSATSKYRAVLLKARHITLDPSIPFDGRSAEGATREVQRSAHSALAAPSQTPPGPSADDSSATGESVPKHVDGPYGLINSSASTELPTAPAIASKPNSVLSQSISGSATASAATAPRRSTRVSRKRGPTQPTNEDSLSPQTTDDIRQPLRAQTPTRHPGS